MVDLPNLPKRENFKKIILSRAGPAYYSIATGVDRETKKGKQLHALEPYKKSIINAIKLTEIREIKRGGLSDTSRKRLLRRILALDDKTPNKPENYKELKNNPFARDKILRDRLLKHFARKPKIAARVQEQFSEDLPTGGQAKHSLVDRRGTGDTLAKANRTTSSGIDDLIKKKSTDPNKMNRLAQNNRLRPDYDNKFGYSAKRNAAVSIDDRPKSPPPIKLAN